MRAIKLFKEKTGRDLGQKKNSWPYLHALVERGVFSKIDTFFAKSILGEERSEEEGLFLALLMAVSRLGHLCLPLEKERIKTLLASFDLEEEESEKIALMAQKGASTLPTSFVEKRDPLSLDFSDKPLVLFDSLLYLQRNWVFETHLVHHLNRLLSGSISSIAFEAKDTGLTEEQCQAVKNALGAPLSLITGGPGTGKTFVAAHIARALLEQKKEAEIILAATTGKAAMQLKMSLSSHTPDAANIRSGTLHSLLEIRSSQDFLQREERLDPDLLIIDECSMIDARLFAELLAAIKEGTRVVLLGDPYQLPPVDSGSFFADLVDAAKSGYPIACTCLTRSLRSDNEEILELAKAIFAGDEKRVLGTKSAFLQLKFDEKSGYQTLWEEARSYFPKPQKEPYDTKKLLENLSRFRILSCVRKGAFGVDALNQMIKERVLHETGQDAGIESWCALPILITKNDKEMGLYNGDTGVLVWNKEKRFALFDTAPENAIPAELLPPYEYAYCLSVHKSQGSEYEKVLLIVPPRAEVFGREILYTGVTRAKKELKIAADSETLSSALKRVSRKISGFHARLR